MDIKSNKIMTPSSGGFSDVTVITVAKAVSTKIILGIYGMILCIIALFVEAIGNFVETIRIFVEAIRKFVEAISIFMETISIFAKDCADNLMYLYSLI